MGVGSPFQRKILVWYCLLCALHATASVSATINPDSLRAFYNYPPGPVQATIRSEPQRWGLRITKVSFPSPVTTQWPDNNTVYGWFVTPRTSKPVPAVVVLHSWGVHDVSRELAFSRTLAQRGLASFVMELPMHIERTPPNGNPGSLMITSDPEQTAENIRQAVIDVRRTVDWLQQQPEVDPHRLGVTGLSLGGVIADLVIGVDRRFSACVSILGAGDMAAIYWDSVMLKNQKAEAKQRGVTFTDVQRAFVAIESTAFASSVPPEEMLMISARYDIVIPRKAVMRTWDAFGRPEIIWVDAGHHGAFLAQGRMFRLAADFLARRFFGYTTGSSNRSIHPCVRLRPGLYGVAKVGVVPGLALGFSSWGTKHRIGIETLVTSSKALLGLAYSPTHTVSFGWGIPVSLRGEPRLYIGLSVTL